MHRIAPLKVTIGLLYRMDSGQNEHEVTMDRALFESVISTMELVVDDLERGRKGDDRKVVEAQPRIAAQQQRA
jgi:hypothetical protein